jgi:polygalacturonase
MTASSKTIVFEKGCIIRAKRGSFRDGGDILITLSGVRDVTLSGFGAILEMNRMDYRRKPYSKAEWRHGIALYECANVLIEGLTIRETGGDGVYIGQRRTQSVCTNITLRNLSLENNYRQGVSVISVRGLLMENCRVIGTSGTAPAAGIDFEPNSGVYGFTECVVRNCEFIDNSGAGILVYLKKMQPDDTPVDIIIDNCVSRKNALSFAIYSIPKGVRGRILIRGGDYSLLKWIRPSKEFTVSFEKP